MKNNKLSLNELKVQSFVTDMKRNVRGGALLSGDASGDARSCNRTLCADYTCLYSDKCNDQDVIVIKI